MNHIRLIWRRLVRRPVVTGPMRFYTRGIPDGVLLDLEEYFAHVITTIADDADAYAMFMEIVDDRAEARGHDGWEPEQLFMEKLALTVGYEVPVRGQALARLADRLKAAAPVGVPAPRRAGAA